MSDIRNVMICGPKAICKRIELNDWMKARFNADIHSMKPNPAALTAKRAQSLGAGKQRYYSAQRSLSKAVLFNDALMMTAQQAAMRNSGGTSQDRI